MVIGYRLLVIDCLLVIEEWLLKKWLLVIGYGLLRSGYRLLVIEIGYWLLVIGY